MSENQCGTCTLCCKLLGIEELDKMPGEWCGHCKVGSGCKIYNGRPPSCESYECVWLTLRNRGEEISDSLRPDRSKVVVDMLLNGDYYFRVDPSRPEAWKTIEMQAFIKAVSTSGKTFLMIGERRRMLAVVNA